MTRVIGLSLLAMAAASTGASAQVNDVFYIAMENHNWTQTGLNASLNQIFGNPAAPYINSLVTPGNPNAAMVSYASNYRNVTDSLGVEVHPSEPNYVWSEAGVHGPLNDADPYPNNIVNAPHLSGVMQAQGKSWKSYQEDIDLQTLGGKQSSVVAPTSQWSVPLTSFSGTSPSYINAYNGSNQYNYAAKHNPQAYFADTNGASSTMNYAPLQQLASDLAQNTVAQYNFLSPDQYNDMHTALTGGFTYNGVHYLGDEAKIAQGDNFLSQIVPLIMASQAFKNNGEIVIWNDETEDSAGVSNGTSMEIVISPLAKGNAYTNTIAYDHSSDLRTLQNIFHVAGPNGYLGGAANAVTLADLYKPGAIPSGVPEVSTWAMMLAGFASLGLVGRKAARRSVA